MLQCTTEMQRSVANKASAHMSSSKITQGTTRSKHVFGSGALYLQEYVSRNTDLHVSVHWLRIIGGTGLHAQGFRVISACANLVRLSLRNGILLPSGWSSKLQNTKQGTPQGGRIAVWICQTHTKSGFIRSSTHPARGVFLQPVILAGTAQGGSAPTLARNAGHSHTSLNQQLPTRCSYFAAGPLTAKSKVSKRNCYRP